MVECFVHIEKVIGSNPISPTFFMIKKYIKILLNTFFYINLNVFNCYSSDKELEKFFFENAYLPKMLYVEKDTLDGYISENKE